MNIVQAHKFFWYRDGASNYAWSLASSLEKAGHTVIPFSTKHTQNNPTAYARYFVDYTDLSDIHQLSVSKKITAATTYLYSRQAKQNMQNLLKEHPIDIVHLHNIYHHISPSILSEIKKRRIPIVMTLHDYKLFSPNYTMFHHGSIHEEDAQGWYLSCIKNKCVKDSRVQSILATTEMIFHHKICRFFKKHIDMLICPSIFMRNLCLKYGWEEKKCIHIPHPVESSSLSRIKGNHVAYIGRLSEEKGLLVLLDAAHQTPNIPYTIVGDGPLKNDIEKYLKTNNIRNVSLVGFKTGIALEKEITHARVLVLPSIWYENYPLSILEAKAKGKIVIGSDIGGIPELLPASCLFPPGDAEALASTIEQWFFADQKTTQAIKKQHSIDIQRINNPQDHLEKIVDLYEYLQKT